MPAYTFRAAGSVASNSDSSALAPGAPAGKQPGDLLVLQAGNQANATFPLPTGWVWLGFHAFGSGSLALIGRIADGTADDTPTIDWTGSAASYACIVAYYGDVYRGHVLESIVVGYARENLTGQTVLPVPACQVNKNDSLVLVAGQKRKTGTSSDATTITAPAGTTKRFEHVPGSTASAGALADVQQTTAADYAGGDFTIDGTADAQPGLGMVVAIRTQDGSISRIGTDWVTENVRTGTTSPQTWTHDGKASGVKGVLLAIVHGTSATDHVSAASYGGVAMSRIDRRTDAAGEPGAAEWWFLGSGVPQGSQTVSYTPGATTDDIHAVCITLVAEADLQSIDTDGVSGDAANPSVTLNAGGRDMLCFGALYGGAAAPTSFTPNDNCFTVHDHDLGAFYSEIIQQAYSQASDFAIGGTSSSDDVAFSAVGISLVPRSWPQCLHRSPIPALLHH